MLTERHGTKASWRDTPTITGVGLPNDSLNHHKFWMITPVCVCIYIYACVCVCGHTSSLIQVAFFATQSCNIDTRS